MNEPHFHHEIRLNMIHYKKSHLTKLQGKLPGAEKLSRNSCHESNAPNPNLPLILLILTFVLSSNQYGAAVSTMTRI
jgi:hypothetical protein